MKIKNEKLFKNKTHMIIYILSFIVLISLFIYIGNINYDTGLTDSILFSKEFKDVPEENVYKYIEANELVKMLDENIIILFGNSSNIWTEDLAKVVNKVAIENEIEEILYYDFFDDRTINNGNYELIVEDLTSYLITDDTGRQDINAPLLMIIKNGKVIYYFDELTTIKGSIDPKDYWNYHNTGIFESDLTTAFNNYKGVDINE